MKKKCLATEILQLQGNYNKLVQQNKELQNQLELKNKMIEISSIHFGFQQALNVIKNQAERELKNIC